jgi:hypothetical protein
MRSRVLLYLAACLAVFPMTAWGAEKPGAPADVTIQGEIVDLACYLGHGARGPDHRQCALKCAQMGQPLGLLARDGKLYILLADHQDPAPFAKSREMAGESVELTGEPAERDGVSALTVHAAKK